MRGCHTDVNVTPNCSRKIRWWMRKNLQLVPREPSVFMNLLLLYFLRLVTTISYIPRNKRRQMIFLHTLYSAHLFDPIPMCRIVKREKEEEEGTWHELATNIQPRGPAFRLCVYVPRYGVVGSASAAVITTVRFPSLFRGPFWIVGIFLLLLLK